MRGFRSIALAGLAALVGFFPLAGSAAAADYPSKNITIMCGFAAGGGGDLICRYFADKLATLSGERTIVENKVGALGTLAAEATARSKPDGYTVLVTPGSATHAAYLYQFSRHAYDPQHDFTMVTTLNRVPFIFVVNPQKQSATSVREFTDWAKARKEKVKHGGSTVTATVASETYRAMSGIDMIQVQYKSAQVAVTDLIAGELDFAICDPGLAVGQIQSGKLRGLAVTSAVRSQALPDLPTMQEAGFPGYDVTGWWAAYVAAKTPPEIVAKLRGWLETIVATDETKSFFNKAGIDTFDGKGLDLAKFQADEIAKWKKFYEIAKIPPQ